MTTAQLTAIAPEWVVANGVIRPVNPWTDKVCHPCIQNSDSMQSCTCEKFEHFDYDIQQHTYATNHTPGSYKAEELGEVVWQELIDGQWITNEHAPGSFDYDFNLWSNHLEDIETRLYIKSKT